MWEPEFETKSNSTAAVHKYSLTSAVKASLQCLATASTTWGTMMRREAINLRDTGKVNINKRRIKRK